jgi:hypothetical protein
VPTYDPDEPLDDAIRTVFGAASEAGVRRLLDAAAGPDGRPLEDRVRLACVLLSEGDVARLRHYLGEAAKDPRDVLSWAFWYDDDAPPHMRSHLRR